MWLQNSNLARGTDLLLQGFLCFPQSLGANAGTVSQIRPLLSRSTFFGFNIIQPFDTVRRVTNSIVKQTAGILHMERTVSHISRPSLNNIILSIVSVLYISAYILFYVALRPDSGSWPPLTGLRGYTPWPHHTR